MINGNIYSADKICIPNTVINKYSSRYCVRTFVIRKKSKSLLSDN
jgi:hypothetical protein